MALNLDEAVKSLKTHSIVLDGKEYVAKPLTLAQLTEIQDLYANHDETVDDGYGPLVALLNAVGYPAEKIIELPVQVVMELQKDLFLSLTEAMTPAEKKKK